MWSQTGEMKIHSQRTNNHYVVRILIDCTHWRHPDVPSSKSPHHARLQEQRPFIWRRMKRPAVAGFQWSSQREQMASINVAAPDRSSLDSFQFLNETLVCKCIVYQLVTTNLSNYFEMFVRFIYKKKIKQWSRSRLGAGVASFILILAFYSVFLECFSFSPSVIFFCSLSLPVPPWCTKWLGHAGTLTEL